MCRYSVIRFRTFSRTVDALKNIPENTLKSAWNKLRPFELQPESTEPEGLDPTSELLDICQSLPAFNSLNEDDVKNWCEIDLPDVGYEMLSDDVIVYVSTEPTEANDEEDDQPAICLLYTSRCV